MQMNNAPFPLPDLPLTDLVQVRAQVDALISEKREKEREAAAEEIRRIVEAFDFSEEEVLTLLKGANAIPVKYRHPENPALTWCGKGRRPLWLNEALNAGISIAKIRVQPAAHAA